MDDKNIVTNEICEVTTLSLVDSSEKSKVTDNIYVGSTITIRDIRPTITKSESVTKFLLEPARNHSSNGRGVISNKKEQSKRKKFREPGVINQYPASDIPNNIGDKSVDKLTDYVNGRDEKSSGKYIKTEKKMKNLAANRKNENDKKQNENLLKFKHSIDGSEIEIQNEVKVYEESLDNIIEPKEPICDSEALSAKIYNKITPNESTKETEHNSVIPDNISGNEDDDDDFYQVVRRKTRNKTKFVRQTNSEIKRPISNFEAKNNIKCNKNFANTSTKDSENESISKNFQIINVNDKQILNWFIYQLWLEFQNKHDKC